MSTTRHSSTISMELTALPASPGSRSDGFAIATCTGAGSVGGTSGELVEAVSTTGSGLFRAIDASATAPASELGHRYIGLTEIVIEHRAWLRCPGELLFGGERGSADVLAWRRAGVQDSCRPERSEQADNPGRENDRCQQWRRPCRKSPRVHHPSLQRQHRNRIAQPSMRTRLIVRTR